MSYCKNRLLKFSFLMLSYNLFRKFDHKMVVKSFANTRLNVPLSRTGKLNARGRCLIAMKSSGAFSFSQKQQMPEKNIAYLLPE